MLGICLGMQLALEHSEEDGGVDGLGLLRGVSCACRPKVGSLVSGGSVVEPWGEAYYFAHSYAVRSSPTKSRVSRA